MVGGEPSPYRVLAVRQDFFGVHVAAEELVDADDYVTLEGHVGGRESGFAVRLDVCD